MQIPIGFCVNLLISMSVSFSMSILVSGSVYASLTIKKVLVIIHIKWAI